VPAPLTDLKSAPMTKSGLSREEKKAEKKRGEGTETKIALISSSEVGKHVKGTRDHCAQHEDMQIA